MKFRSTRGLEQEIASAKAIINGISKDGGLYVPDYFPRIYDELKKYTEIKYEDLAFKVINEFFTDIDDSELMKAINDAYNGRLKVKVKKDFLELYHGPTYAFKDAALLFLPQIMKRAKRICNIKEDITILTATSGDTGKAALEGFAKVDGFKVVVYYPKNGVSQIQERQMISQEGDNVKVIGINGNFDDAQTGVKEIFADNEFRSRLMDNGYRLSSANSINIGRLVPQIVYYFYGYFSLVNRGTIKLDEFINVAVPTGNFGNILAGYYAKQMGLPIDKFICASNENNVLTDFFKTGIYDKKRELVLTESPSMDILVSSNLERLIYEACGRRGKVVEGLMKQLNTEGMYEVNDEIREFIRDFYGNYATREEIYDAIKEVYEKQNYVMDTHTAVAYAVKEKYIKETKDDKQVLVVSTASPFKFPRSICSALNIDVDEISDFEVLKRLSEAIENEIPENLSNLENSKILHDEVCDKGQMRDAILAFLNVHEL